MENFGRIVVENLVDVDFEGSNGGFQSLKLGSLCDRLDIGATALRELFTPGTKNFDSQFPRPFRLTDNGHLYFDVAEVERWFSHRKRLSRAVNPCSP